MNENGWTKALAEKESHLMLRNAIITHLEMVITEREEQIAILEARKNIVISGLVKRYNDLEEDCAWEINALREQIATLTAEIKGLREEGDLLNRTASCLAHRACCGTEHEPLNGKLHGHCVVCGVPWPCDTAKTFLLREDLRGGR